MSITANASHSPNIEVMLGRPLRSRSIITTTLDERLMLAGIDSMSVYFCANVTTSQNLKRKLIPNLFQETFL